MDSQKGMTVNKAVYLIENNYHAQADRTNLNFDVFDQLYVCELLAEQQQKETTNENVYVNESANDTYKRNVNNKSNQRKLQVIAELKACHYRTPPRKVASLLEELFISHESKEGHWLYVAQNWNPRAINRVIRQMINLHKAGIKTIENPAAYFTYLIKHRKPRRKGQLHGA